MFGRPLPNLQTINPQRHLERSLFLGFGPPKIGIDFPFKTSNKAPSKEGGLCHCEVKPNKALVILRVIMHSDLLDRPVR